LHSHRYTIIFDGSGGDESLKGSKSGLQQGNSSGRLSKGDFH